MNPTYVSTSITSVNATFADYSDMYVECCGERLAPDIAAVQRFMAHRRIPYADQKLFWLDFAQQVPDLAWGALCLEQAERVEALLSRMRALAPAAPAVGGASAAAPPGVPPSPCALRHFEWRGAHHGVAAESLREGILQLSELGLVAPDAAQHDALRRGLGCSANAAERTTPIPWVRWLGNVDMLTYLVAALYRADLISCAGGPQEKWQVVRGLFLQADGSLLRDDIRTSRLRNAAKRDLLDRRFLSPLRRAAAR